MIPVISRRVGLRSNPSKPGCTKLTGWVGLPVNNPLWQPKRVEDIPILWYQFLLNPIWYVITTILLTILVFHLRFLWWSVSVVALAWGLWIMWRLFKVDPTEVNDLEELKAYLEQMQLYKSGINQMLKNDSIKSNPAHRQQLAAQVTAWTEIIQNLIQHLTSLYRDNIIQHDNVTVPEAIKVLAAQLARETDIVIRTQLESALATRGNQLASLKMLQDNLRRAEIQIENTLSLLGTIYSQLLISQSTEYVVDYNRLLIDVTEEVYRLQDQLEALREVREAYRGRGAN